MGRDGRDDDNEEERADLANRVKQLQRESEESKQQWWSFCEMEGFSNRRDPNRHTSDFLRRFFDARRDGRIPAGRDAAAPPQETDPELHKYWVGRVKQVQRSSPDQKQKWENFCDTHGGGVRDPQRHDSRYLQRFFQEVLGDHGAGAGAGWGAAPCGAGGCGAFGGGMMPGYPPMGGLPMGGFPHMNAPMHAPMAAPMGPPMGGFPGYPQMNQMNQMNPMGQMNQMGFSSIPQQGFSPQTDAAAAGGVPAPDGQGAYPQMGNFQQMPAMAASGYPFVAIENAAAEGGGKEKKSKDRRKSRSRSRRRRRRSPSSDSL